MTAIASMTAKQIQDRLKQLESETSAHQNRDLDSEIRQALLAGADVDALEASQLEAERLQRRHRVERQALEQALPAAKQREAAATLAGMATAHQGLQRQAERLTTALVDHGTTLASLLREFEAVQQQAAELTRQAANLSADTGAALPPNMGVFIHAQLAAIALRLREPVDHLARTAGQAQATKAGLQGTTIG